MLVKESKEGNKRATKKKKENHIRYQEQQIAVKLPTEMCPSIPLIHGSLFSFPLRKTLQQHLLSSRQIPPPYLPVEEWRFNEWEEKGIDLIASCIQKTIQLLLSSLQFYLSIYRLTGRLFWCRRCVFLHVFFRFSFTESYERRYCSTRHLKALQFTSLFFPWSLLTSIQRCVWNERRVLIPHQQRYITHSRHQRAYLLFLLLFQDISPKSILSLAIAQHSLVLFLFLGLR